MKKQLFYLALPPLSKLDFGGLIFPVQDLEDAKILQKELGGRILSMELFYN